MKVASVVGARPQFIKSALMSEELRKSHSEVLIHTGQHYDYEMSKVFFDELEIVEPDYNLDVGSGSHGLQTGLMLERIEKVLLDEKPDCVIVYGDTNSTLAGALAGSKLQIPVVHIEAGLRSFNRKMAEEINRVVTDHISSLLFCPTETAVKNLKNEGISDGVYEVGDVMYDVFLSCIKTARKKSKVLSTLNLKSGTPNSQHYFDTTPKDYVLVTIHRAENTDDIGNLSNIVSALANLNRKVVFPVHPRTRKQIQAFDMQKYLSNSNVLLTEPMSYFDMLVLEERAQVIITDSGGVQKEAYWSGVPCITLRGETEWVETVDAGWNVLVAADKDKIVEKVEEFKPASERRELFGGGKAVKRIVEVMTEL